MIEKIKKNWKNILIVFVVLFGMNQCAKRCTNGQHYKTSQELADSLQQVSDSQKIVIDKLSADTANYLNQIRMLKGFDMKRNTQDSINNANIKAQKAQTDALIRKLNSRK